MAWIISNLRSVIYAVNSEVNDDPLIQIRMISSLKPIVVTLGGKTENPEIFFFPSGRGSPNCHRHLSRDHRHGQTAQKKRRSLRMDIIVISVMVIYQVSFFAVSRIQFKRQVLGTSFRISVKTIVCRWTLWLNAWCIMCILVKKEPSTPPSDDLEFQEVVIRRLVGSVSLHVLNGFNGLYTSQVVQ